MTRTLAAEPVTAERYELGEGPRWDGARLCWVDILTGRLVLADWAGGTARVTGGFTIDRPLGAVAPRAGGDGWVVAAGRGFGLLSGSGELTMLAEPEPAGHRMNDGACDPSGRFFGGSMAYDSTPGAATLYRLDRDGAPAPVRTGLTISNGIGWSPDGGTCYLADSGAGTLSAFAYDAASGTLGARRMLVDNGDGPGAPAPDGLTVDDDGGIWVALWNAGAVHRYTPDGALDTVVRLPTPQPTSCCFVGGTLVVTTAYYDLPAPGPLDGAVYAVEVGVSGQPAHRYAG